MVIFAQINTGKMTKNIPQFLIAAPTSGSGKTTVSRGLMALLKAPSVNLDLFMASEEHVRRLYARYAVGADACVVEGMMGMFDGYERDRGSSAEVARLLRLPVVLVVDARSAAYSLAPLLQGFLHFRPDIRFAGVIFNRVGSARHFGMLQEVCEDLQVECLGYLPKDGLLEQGSRYLGLDWVWTSANRKRKKPVVACWNCWKPIYVSIVCWKSPPNLCLRTGRKMKGWETDVLRWHATASLFLSCIRNIWTC